VSYDFAGVPLLEGKILVVRSKAHKVEYQWGIGFRDSDAGERNFGIVIEIAFNTFVINLTRAVFFI
jgi:hypothetical protein